ncbi:MAG TPA: hypothetical protein DCX53_09020 [Anaerolineae bacterium]|nr:hypothetical protein [Anaerolineae bacterium]
MYGSLQLKILLFVSILLVASCGPSSPTPVAPATEEEFTAAVEKAHSTMSVVRQALLAPEPSFVFIGLKIRVYGDVEFEDIWTEPLDYFNGAFTTQMVEGVALTQGFHPDQVVRIPVEDVIDWMIVEDDGNLIGGYTIRLAYQHMTPEEQEEFIRITGYTVESLLKKD